MAGTTSDKLNLLRQIKEAFRVAITGKGQTISDDEPYSAWPDKVAAIETGIDTSDATATATDIAKDKTAYVNGKKVTGDLTEKTDSHSFFNSTPSFSTVTGMFNLINEITSDQILRTGAKLYFAYETKNFGDATAADVAKGKTFTSKNGLKVVGTAAGGAAKVVKITTSTRSHTLSITGLSKSDYGYLLGCNTIMIYGEAGWGAYDLHSAICTIGSDVLNNDKYGTHNKQICVGPSYSFETGMNDIQEVSIVEESAGIKISIVAESQYFTAESNYYVVGFNV